MLSSEGNISCLARMALRLFESPFFNFQIWTSLTGDLKLVAAIEEPLYMRTRVRVILYISIKFLLKEHPTAHLSKIGQARPERAQRNGRLPQADFATH
jgi:hypothetical protein